MSEKELIKQLEEIVVDNHKEIERLNNILKEAIKYIEKNTDNTNFLEVPSKELLEILAKGSE